jgi:hypothetical protein
MQFGKLVGHIKGTTDYDALFTTKLSVNLTFNIFQIKVKIQIRQQTNLNL